jgi:DNA invertase Pin-like site-specific DNA recombinase
MFIDLGNVRRAVTIEELAKAGYTYVGIIRTSTSEQKDNLEVQESDVKARMTVLGFKKPLLMAVANVSGAKAARAQIREVFDAVKALPEKKRKVVVVARSVDRLSRDTEDALRIQRELAALGVYLYIIDNNLLLNGDGTEQGSNQLVFELLLAVAKNAKRAETEASKQGTKEAKEKGLFSGTPQDGYVDLIKDKGSQRGKSVFRRINESRGALIAKTATIKGLARDLSGARTFYPAKVREIIANLQDLEEQGGPEKVEEYLQVWDARIKEEKKRGVGRISAKGRMTDRQRAIHRVSVAYLQEPMNWPRPDTVGNPDTATVATPDRTGTIADASANPLAYLPRAR